MIIKRRRFGLQSRTDAGFTLSEASIGIAIFGICFGALLAGLTWNVSVVKLSRETVRATQVMEEKLDTIRLYSFDQINTPGFITNQFFVPFSPTNAFSTSSPPGITYTGVITIGTSPLTESYRSNLLQITIDLYWPSTPQVRHAQMSTFVSKYGMQGYIY
jgi:type II secretory pathway pseudopilin PulG